LLTCAVAMGTMVTTGCSSAQALTDVSKFEPVVIDALTLACTIDPSLPACGTGQATIQSDYNLLVKVWGDYNTAVTNGTATVAQWNYLNAVFTTFEQDSSAILSAGLSLNAPELQAIVDSAQVLLAAVEVMFPSAPAGAQSAKSAVFTAKAKPASVYGSAWLQGWIKDYNAKCDVAQKAHPTVKLHKVHYHGAIVRYGTLGWAK